MARKTAMGKEPGNVSIALPKSEKDKIKTGGRNLPGKPPAMDDKGNLIGKQSLERVSPGVYRNSQGKLVGSKGQALPKPSPIQNALQGAGQAAGMEGGKMPAGRLGQQMSPQESEAAIQAETLANSIMDQYKVPGMGNQQTVPYPAQIQSGVLMYPEGTRFPSPMPIQNLMYPFPQGQTPPDMRLFAPANPQGMNTMQNLQPQVATQPNTVSGLLRRGR